VSSCDPFFQYLVHTITHSLIIYHWKAHYLRFKVRTAVPLKISVSFLKTSVKETTLSKNDKSFLPAYRCVWC